MNRTNFAVTVVSCILSILLCLVSDFILSKFSAVKIRPVLRQYVKRYPDGFYELKPDLRQFPDTWGGTTFDICSDKNGFRINCNPEKHVGSPVVFLGDSFIWGGSDYWDRTIVGIFEEISNRRVVNLGFSSYSPTVYLHQYRKYLDSVIEKEPHDLVIGIDMSDVQDEATRWVLESGCEHPVLMKKHTRDAEKKLTRDADREGLMQRGNRFFSRNFKFTYKLTKQLYRRLLLKFKPEKLHNMSGKTIFQLNRSSFTFKPWEETSDQYQPLGIAVGLSKIEEKISEIAELASRNNASSVSLLIYPWPGQIHYGQRVFNFENFAYKLCEKSKCSRVINAFNPLQEAAAGNKEWYTDLFINGDIHYNYKGNRIIANEINESLGHK